MREQLRSLRRTPFVLACIVAASGCGSQTGAHRTKAGDPAWEAVRRAILSCKIKEISQTHARYVSVRMLDGRELTARERRIDDVGRVFNRAHCKRPILFATE